jgi:hypothetical protein
MTHQRPTPPLPRQQDQLSYALVALAGTPDDHSGVEDQLIMIAQLSAQRISAVSYASVTARHDGAYTTVAASDAIAVAVDEAQYADQSGPCLDAIRTAKPLAVPEIATTMRWPGFRDTAYRLGLHTSLSIPIFAGRGEPIAALNLYGHDPTAMTALTSAVWAVYEEDAQPRPGLPGPDPGGAELVEGLTSAFAVRAIIQQAIGIIMDKQPGMPEHAYTTLRLRAADTDNSLLDTANAVITGQR